MRVVAILMAWINSLMGGIFIVSCISASEPPGWVMLKSSAGILAICFGILTFKDEIRPTSQKRKLFGGLFLMMTGMSALAWGFHWSLVSGDAKNTILLFGGSILIQGLASILGMAGDTF